MQVFTDSSKGSSPGQISRVAIVGTGFVGATTAYALLLSGTAAEIVVIDRHPERAEGHVNDLKDAALFSHNTHVPLSPSERQGLEKSAAILKQYIATVPDLEYLCEHN